MQSNRIVVVGSGFAGFWAAMSARRVGGDAVAITLVSREPVLQIRPRLYEAAPETLGVELRQILERTRVDFVEGEAAGLAPSDAELVLASGERIGYDRLVVATGSRLRRPAIPGVESCWCVDTQAEAIAFDRRLARIAAETDEPRVAIIGAGFTGIELALELRDRLLAHGNAKGAERLQILLIDRARDVGPELGAGPRPAIEAALAAANVRLLLGASVTAIHPERVEFANGSTVHTHAVVLATGMVAAPFASRVPGDRDALGRVLVDVHLRAKQCPHVYVAGDAAAAVAESGHLVMQACQHAVQLGKFAGENAARDLLQLPLVPFDPSPYVTCLDLGRSGAVFTEGWERKIRLTGADAKALKQQINRVLIYPPADAPVEELLARSKPDPTRTVRSRAA